MASSGTGALGKRTQRIDGVAKVTGKAEYTGDLQVHGLLHAKIIWSTVPQARIKQIRTEKAEKYPGVRKVITAKDVPNTRFNMIGIPTPDAILDQTIFCIDKVRCIGDPIGAVIANSPEAAREASKLVEVDYEPLPAVFDPEEALKPNAPLVHEDMGSNLLRVVNLTHGDVEKGFKESDYVFEDEFVTQRQKHCQTERHVCVANYDKIGGKLTVWTPTQMPFQVRYWLSKVFGMPEGRIRVIVPFLGGGFGGRLNMILEPIAGACSMIVNAPVKVQLTREEDFFGSEPRHGFRIKHKVGVKKDGTILGLQSKVVADTGAYATHGLYVAFVGGSYWRALYKSPNIKFEGYVVYTNNPSAGGYRGYGNPQMQFARESHLDMVAERLGMDPLEFRIKNHINVGDVNLDTDWVLKSCGLDECIQKGAEAIDWQKKRYLKPEERGTVKKRGVGMACGLHTTAIPHQVTEVSGATITLNEDGTFNLLVGNVEQGAGLITVLAQVAAEELGVSTNEISVYSADTEITPYDYGTHASRGTAMGSGAVKAAAEDARKQILEGAAELLEANPNDLELKEKKISVKGSPGIQISLSDLATSFNRLGKAPDSLGGKKLRPRQVIGSASYTPPGSPPSFFAHFAEVEVDTETGVVKPLMIVGAFDVGHALNPMNVEGQIEGAVHHGLGYALTEEVITVDGKVLNPDFLNYKLFYPLDMPVVKSIIVEHPDPDTAYGVKGVGESGLVTVAPAIANAVYNAVGIRIKSIPITPEKVLQALGKLEK